jgi:hypothetical protein
MGLVSGMKGIFGGGRRRKVDARAPLFVSRIEMPRGESATRAEPSGGGLQFPRFQAMATDQLDRSRTDRFGAVRMKLRSAFTPSQPVANRQMFAGRSAVLTSMIRSIEDQRLHLVLYGERGIGKTSLLHMLAEAAREARYIVLYSSCGAGSDFQETFRAAAEEIPVLFHSGFSPTTADAERGQTLSDLLPSAGFSPRQFADMCAKLTGTRVLIILDEFDRATSTVFRRDISELMKFLSDRSVRVQLVIAGVAADLAELIEHTPSIRRNLLAVRVPLMDTTEIQALVANGERISGLTFDVAARDIVVSVAHGSPYVASLLCHHAGIMAIDAGRMIVTASDAAGALDEALIEFEGRIAKQAVTQIHRLQKDGLGPLLATISGVALAAGGDFDLVDLAAEIPEAELSQCKKLVEKLAAERMLLTACDDEYRKGFCFIEEGIRHYIWFLGAQRLVSAGQMTTRRASNA